MPTLTRLVLIISAILVACLHRASGQPGQPNPINTTKKDSTAVLFKRTLIPWPIVAASKETSWIFGVAPTYIFKTDKLDSMVRLSTIQSGLLYTLNQQILIGVGGSIYFPKEKYIIRFENTASKYPDKFWGVGNDTDNKEYEAYTYTQFFLNPQIYRKIKKSFFLGVGIDFQRVFKVDYVAGGYFDQEKILGVYDKTDYSVFGYSFFIMVDSRNHTYSPNKGELFRVRFTNFSKNIGSDYSFQALELDYRKFIKISRRSTLGIHSYGLFNFGEPPFRNLALLGSFGIMRGYFAGRYRDNKFWGAQVEYRFPIAGRFGGVAFAAAGQVAHVFSDFGFGRFKPSVGTGLRYAILPKEKLNFRVDVGFGSNNSVNYYFVVAESF